MGLTRGRVLATLIVGGLLAPCAGEVSSETVFREALYIEQTLRQPERAIEIYRHLIDAAQTVQDVRVEAHLRMGICLQRLGQTDQARRQYEMILRQYSDHAHVVEQVRDRLAAISASDPATLMPYETPLYVELIRPGLQAGRFIASLKGLDVDGLEVLLKRLIGAREYENISRMLNSVVREDLTHIDSAALGVISYEDLPGSVKAKCLLVVHPGMSLAARGFLAMWAQGAGKPSGFHHDIKLWDIPDGPDGVLTFASLPDRPGLSAAMILGKDRQIVCEAIDRYQAGAKAKGLASHPEFRRQAGARRRDSAMILYVDVPRVLSRVQQEMKAADRENYQAGRELLGLDTVERGMARVSLLDDGLLVELSLMFNDKDNPFYTMCRTPPVDRSLLGLVPAEASASLLMSVDEGGQKWIRVREFLDRLSSMDRPRGRWRLGDLGRHFGRFESLTGLSFREEIVGNCRGLVLILWDVASALPTSDGVPLPGAVLALQMNKPDDFSLALGRSVAKGKGKVQGQQPGGIQSWSFSREGSPQDELRVARVGGVFFFSSGRENLDRTLRAQVAGDVIDRSEMGRWVAEMVPSSASKVLLLRPEKISNGVRALEGLPAMDLRPVRPMVVYTIEQANQVAIRLEVGDLTDLLNSIIRAAGARVPETVPAVRIDPSRRPVATSAH